MPTTSNFGWTTPADTDLVKDGAAAIRTLGNGVDASFVDLKGGTTDQVLAKNSNTDLDFKWVAADDADAIQKSLIDAEGDLIVGDAADAVQRLAIGSNGNILTVDTSVDGKIKWAAPAASGFTFQAWTPSYTNLTIGNGTVTARYGTSGKFTYFEWFLKFGSTTSVTGVISVSLPTTPKNYGTGIGLYLPITFLDSGTQIYFGRGEIDKANTRITLYAETASGTYVERTGTSSSVPFTWTTNDEITIQGSYEEA